MKKHILPRKFISFAVAFAMMSAAATMMGCASNIDDGRNDAIELVDPVSIKASCAAVERRNMYDITVTSATVCPKVSEVSFTSDLTFYSYAAMPGEEVKKGDVLINGDTENIDDQIKAQNEKIADMQEEYNDSHEQLAALKEKDEADYNTYSQIIEKLDKEKPEAGSTTYDKWMSETNYASYDSKMRYAYVAFKNDELSLKEKEELFQVDLAHEKAVLNRLYDQKKQRQLIASADGNVVAIGYYDRGNYIRKDSVGMVIGDTSVKEVRCNYINQGTINKAKDVYGIVNGKRYELEYQPMNTQEYDMLYKKNGNVMSTFSIEDPNDEVKQGDFVAIVMVNDIKKDVLAVPKSAINTDTTGNYVFVLDGESYTEKYVRTGLSDSNYVEILSGLEEGDTVKCEYKIKSGANETILKKGRINSTFSANGYLFYPSPKQVLNPVTYGVTYFDEICVSRYEQVEKGQVIAKVHVVSDSILIDRTARNITRLYESLNELQANYDKQVASGADKYTLKNLEKQIEAKKKQIKEAEDSLADMKKDASTKEIVANCSGIVNQISNYKAGDIIDVNASVATISDESSSYIIVEDSDKKLSYGNSAQISYKDASGQSKTVTGTVVTANPMTISSELRSGYALIGLPTDAIGDMALTNQNADGWWSMTRFGLTATLRDMDNVILVPRAAVTDVGGTTYVTVKEDNGSLKMVSFVAGGSDASNYWVVEGLEEGQTICWE